MRTVIQLVEETFASIPLPILEVWGLLGYLTGLVLAVLAFGGFTFRINGRWSFGRERQAWDAKAFLCMPLTFVLILASGYAGSNVVLVPGAQTFESVKDLVVFLCIVLFGYPALVTVPFAYGLSDLAEGVSPASLTEWLAGYFINPACFWIAYQLFGRNPDFRKLGTWGKYGLFVLAFMALEPVLWGYICSGEFGPAVAYRTLTPALFFTTALTWIMAPVAMLGALPLARRAGLYWAEIPGHIRERAFGPGSRKDGKISTEPPGESKGEEEVVPIRMVILVPFILLVLVMVWITAFITLSSAGNDARKLADRLHREVSENIAFRLNNYLARGKKDGGVQAEELQALLSGLPFAKDGRVFLLEKSGQMIAASSGADDPVVQKTREVLAQASSGWQRVETKASFDFRLVTARPLSNETWRTHASAFAAHPGMSGDWIIVTVMPESFYLAGVQTGISQSARIFALALLLSLALAAMLASVMTKRLRDISEAARVLSMDNLARRVPGSRLEELDALSRSFNYMADRLRNSFESLLKEVGIRKRAEEQVQRLNRTYAMLSAINQLIVRTVDTPYLLEGACRIAGEKGGFLMAWIGLIDGETGALKRVAQHGADADTLKALETVFTDSSPGCIFTARALKGGEHVACNRIKEDPGAAPWRELAMKRSYRSMVALPLTIDGKRIGTFNLYAGEADFFDEAELKLLDELAMDISFALGVNDREKKRQATEERFRELAETIKDVFWIRDPVENKILYVSPAYETIWGGKCSELQENPGAWSSSIHPDDREAVRHAAETRQTEGSYDEEYRIIRPDGKVRWIRDVAFPVRGANGRVERIVGVAQDISDRRLLEEQFRQAQKMEAVGQLAGGIAHDFNNILAAIMLQTDLLKMAKLAPPEISDGLEQIHLFSERAASLTRQMLLFSRKQVMQPRNLDLNEIVTSLTKMLQRIIGEDIQLQLDLAADAPVARADAAMLDQVLMNLAVNARDAMPEGGRLAIRTSRVQLTRKDKSLPPDLQAGTFLVLSVADSGSGIPPEVLPHIFDPFFTTKDPGKGTGLGLATVFGIVKQHQGWIDVESQPDKGTCFKIFLPAVMEQAEKTGSENGAAAPKGGSETILICEDDQALAALTHAVLEQRGYRVLHASNGREALELWKENRREIALLLTDLVMPGGLSGRKLAQVLKDEKPAVKVIYTSGYSVEFAGKEMDLRSGVNFLQKPSSIDRLLETVRKSLDS